LARPASAGTKEEISRWFGSSCTLPSGVSDWVKPLVHGKVFGEIARGLAPVRVHLVQAVRPDHDLADASSGAVADDRAPFAVSFCEIRDITCLDICLPIGEVDDLLVPFVPFAVDQIFEDAGQVFRSEARPVAAGHVT